MKKSLPGEEVFEYPEIPRNWATAHLGMKWSAVNVAMSVNVTFQYFHLALQREELTVQLLAGL